MALNPRLSQDTRYTGTFLRPAEWDQPAAGLATSSTNTSSVADDDSSSFEFTPYVSGAEGLYSFAETNLEPERQPGFLTSVGRGIQQTQALLYGALGLAGDALHIQPVEDFGYEGYARNMAEAENYPRAISNIREVENVGDAWMFFRETLGELVPSMVTAVGTGGAGALATRSLAGQAVKRGIANRVARTVTERGVSQEVAERAVLGTLGSQLGVFSSTAALEAGGAWGGNVETLGMGNTNPAMDLTVGVLNGALELLMGAEPRFLRRLTGIPASDQAERSFIRTFVSEVGKNGMQEFTTESLQEITNVVNTNLQSSGFTEILKPGDILNVLDAGIAGAIGGVGFSTVTSLVQRKGTAQSQADRDKANRDNNPLSEAARIQQRNQQAINQGAQDDRTKLEQAYQNQLAELNRNEASTISQLMSSSNAQTPQMLEIVTRTQQANSVQRAKLEEQYKKSLEELDKDVSTLQTMLNRDVQKAQRQQMRIDNQINESSIVADPQIETQVLELTEDAAEISYRVNQNIQTQIQDLRTQIAENNRIIDESINSGTMADFDPEYVDSLQKKNAVFQKTLVTLQKKQKQITATAKRIATRGATLADTDVEDFFADLRELYAAADTNSSPLISPSLFLNSKVMTNPDLTNQEKRDLIREEMQEFQDVLKARTLQDARNTTNQYIESTVQAQQQIASIEEEHQMSLMEEYNYLGQQGRTQEQDGVYQKLNAVNKELVKPTPKPTEEQLRQQERLALYQQESQRLQQEMIDAGATPEEAQASAQLLIARYRTLESRYGIDGIKKLQNISIKNGIKSMDSTTFNQFFGEEITKDLPALERPLANAKLMSLDSQFTPEDIYRETGWIKKEDGFWRYEVADDADLITVQTVGTTVPLSIVYLHRNLLRLIPDSGDLKVITINDSSKNWMGTIDEDNNIIINRAYAISKKDYQGTLLHELQHVIQNKFSLSEGWDEEALNDIFRDSQAYDYLIRHLQNYITNTYTDQDFSSYFPYYKSKQQALSDLEVSYFSPHIQRRIKRLFDIEVKSVANYIYTTNLGEQEARETASRGKLSERQRRSRRHTPKLKYTPTNIIYSNGTWSFVNMSTEEYSQRVSSSTKRRGFVQILRDGRSIISLTKNRNASTLPHETGHIFLADMFDINESPETSGILNEDITVIRDYLGMSEEQTRPDTKQHEKFARSFEAYLREGRAPSQGLQRVFETFKNWLTNIYQTITGLRVTLTPEMRQVFDRMLATDQEINQNRFITGEIQALPAGTSNTARATRNYPTRGNNTNDPTAVQEPELIVDEGGNVNPQPIAPTRQESNQQGLGNLVQELPNVQAIRNRNNLKELGNATILPVLSTNEDIAAAETTQLQEEAGAEVVETKHQTPTAKAVRGWLNNLLKKLPLLEGKVKVVSNPNSITLSPKALQAIAQAEEQEGVAVGVYDEVQDCIFLFSDNITDPQQALRSLKHEGISHYGIDSFLSEGQALAFYSGIHTSVMRGDSNLKTLWDRFITERGSLYSEEIHGNPVAISKEFVAWFSESIDFNQVLTRSENTLWSRIKEFIHTMLKNLGMVRITERDIRDVLASSARYLAGQQTAIEQAQTNRTNNEIILMMNDGTYRTIQVDEQVVWGNDFQTLAKAILYNTRLNENTSGVPNVIYSNMRLDSTNTIIGRKSINQQQPYVRDLLRFLASDPEYGLFSDQTANEEFFNQMTGLALYEALANKLGKKEASQALAGLGIYGFQHANNRTTLFRALETSLIPANLETPYFFSFVTRPTTGTRAAYLYDWSTDDVTLVQPDPAGVSSQTEAERLNATYQNQKTWIDKMIVRGLRRGEALVGEDRIPFSAQDRFIELLQDRYHMVRKAQVFLETVSKVVIDRFNNVYKVLTGLQNRIHAGQSALDKTLVRPLRELMNTINLSSLGINRRDPNFLEKAWEVLGRYAHAKHAAERNAEIQRRLRSEKYRKPDGTFGTRTVAEGKESRTELFDPSGMSNEQAQRILDEFANVTVTREDGTTGTLDDALGYLQTINEKRLSMLVEGGFVTQQDADTMQATYSYYVPLKMWEDFMETYAPSYVFNRGGSGSISVGNRKMMQYAGGRTDMPFNPAVMSIFQMFDTIAVVQKNNTSRAVLELARADKDHTLFEINKVEGQQRPFDIVPRDGLLYFRQKEYKTQGSGYTHIFVIDETGKNIPIAIKDKKLGDALTGRNMAPISSITRFLGNITRFMARMSTTYSPAFIITNPFRDFQTALLNLGNVIAENEKRGLMENATNIRKRMVGDLRKGYIWRTIKAIVNNDQKTLDKLRKSHSDVDQLIQEWIDFEENGGHTRVFNEVSIEATYKSLTQDLNRQDFVGKTANSVKRAADFLDSLSDVTENFSRFAVYRHVFAEFQKNINQRVKDGTLPQSEVANEISLAKQKAANISLEITVNFTQKGTASPVINTLYAFSNATIQGSARILKNLWREGDPLAKNMGRVGSYLSVGVIGAMTLSNMCRFWMGDDDDGINRYDKIPDYIKYMNMIIPVPFTDGKYIKLPMAYGYNIFWAMGVALDDMFQGNKNVTKVGMDLVKQTFNGFSPVDPTEGIANWIPTVFRPIAQILENKTFAGTPIYPENTMSDIPDSQKTWASTPQAYKIIANFLNGTTGGSEFESGLIDISPESIEHVVGSYFGGLGRLFTDTTSLMGMMATGQQWDTNNIPALNRFFGETNYKNTSSLYNQVAGQIAVAKNALNIADQDKTLSSSDRQGIRSKYQDLRPMITTYDSARRAITRIRNQQKALLTQYPGGTWDRTYNEKMLALQGQMERVMQRFLRQANTGNVMLHQNN